MFRSASADTNFAETAPDIGIPDLNVRPAFAFARLDLDEFDFGHEQACACACCFAQKELKFDAPATFQDDGAPVYANGVDIPGNFSTYATISIGQTVSDELETVGDKDWFKITLQAGDSIDISLFGSGNSPVSDTFVRLFDANGVLIAQNDDGGSGLNSYLRYAAENGGSFYIEVDSYANNKTGGYTLSVTETQPLEVFTYDQIADQLVTGFWGGFSRSFDVGADGILTYNLTALSPDAQYLAEQALLLWSDVTGIQFVAVTGAAEITFQDTDEGAFATSSRNGSRITASTVNVEASWIGLYGSTLDSYSFQTFVHEIGHALGLGHAGNYDGSGSYALEALFANDAWSTTVMSYFDQNENLYFDDLGFTFAPVTTPMNADVVAMALLYGPPTDTRLGDTTYGFNSNAGRDVYDATLYPDTAYTIIDSGGVDTLDYSGFANDQLINLGEETFSNVGAEVGNVVIARGTVIENAIGGSGDDFMYGNAANNELRGGAGTDHLYGGAGNDLLSGGSSDDTLFGGEGDDAVFGDLGADYLFGEQGADTLYGDAGNDQIYGGIGSDLIYGDEDDDLLYGNEDADSIYGGSGNDRLEGGDGTDKLYGGFGVDMLLGGAGSDILFGNDGGDLLFGEKGDDTLYGDAGRDRIYGGDGSDLIFGGDGDDQIYGGGDVDEIYGGTGNDRLDGGDGADVLYGGFGIDTLFGGANNDSLFGNDGADLLFGEKGDDVLYGDAGQDTIYGGEGSDLIFGGEDGDWLYGYGDADRIYGGNGNDLLDGGDGWDILYGGLGGDTLLGGEGVDILNGNEGTDTIRGEAGNDYLHGHDGDDFLSGGLGNDLLQGGPGEDIFFFDLSGSSNSDSVDDFVSGIDKFQLDRSGAFHGLSNLGALSVEAFHVGTAAQDADDRIIYNQATGELFYDADGNGAGRAEIFATVKPGTLLSAGDFEVVDLSISSMSSLDEKSALGSTENSIFV